MNLKYLAHFFLVVDLSCLSSLAVAQVQIGDDIDGSAADDLFGISASLSSDGDRLAALAWWSDGGGENFGHAAVYQWLGTSWEQLGADINGEMSNDSTSVALSSDGSRLAIGGTGPDRVRVYQWSGANWEQLGASIDAEAPLDWFGWSISLSSSGDRLAVGAPYSDTNGERSGHARVYQWSGTEWEQLGVGIDGEVARDEFGFSVALSADGSRLAVGAPRHGDDVTYASYTNADRDAPGKVQATPNDAGHVRIYQWSGAEWQQLGDDIDGEAAGDQSGIAVALSSDGSRVAIGANYNDGNGTESGHARIYQWSGLAWKQVGADIDGEAAYDHSGVYLSLSGGGNRVAIGAPGNDGNGSGSGHARVFQWSGEGWEQIGVDIDGEAAGDESGTVVSLSSNGKRVAIGAPVTESFGHVRVYDLSELTVFQINPGLNDHWYNPVTDGQGFYITVFPDLGKVNLTGFTWDTEHPPQDASANFGNPGHRWFNALGKYADNQALMNIKVASGGLFDTPFKEAEVTSVKDGTIILTFDGCNSGTIEYDIPSIGRAGTIPIQRIVGDNIALCEAFNSY